MGSLAWLIPLTLALGCQIPTHAERGALFGGLAGAGTGAIIGNAVGATGPGAVIGAAVGGLSGTVVGQSLDNIEDKNQADLAQLQAQIPRQMAGTVTIDDVVSMTKSGVAPDLIVNHIRNNGAAQVLTANDLITLQNSGVDTRVISAMQTQPQMRMSPAPGPAVVERHYYSDSCWGPPYYYYHCHRPRPRVGWGVSFSSGGCR
jgi:hypothetical protein